MWCYRSTAMRTCGEIREQVPPPPHQTHRFSSPSDGLGSCSLGTCSIHLNSIQQPIMRD